jgi:D-glycero-D-manno-heptose 1,7-bisphosphate phosphatase
MGRFSVDRSMSVDGQPPSPTMTQTQQYGTPYGQQNYGSPYGQQMPQQQGMMMQQQQQNWPTFFPKETIGIDRGAILNDTKSILNASDIEILPGALDAIRTIRLKGYKLVIFFNEPLISQGKLTTQAVDANVQQLMNYFGQAGIFTIDGLLYSTSNMKEDLFAMPNNGMMKRAETEMKVAFKGGYFAGNKLYNLKAGDSVHAKPILIKSPGYEDTETKLDTFANKELKNKTKTFNSLLDFANSLQ